MTSAIQDEGRDAIARAMAGTREAMATAEADPGRPAFHFRPPARWMNDPNGPIFYRGWYHLFYQFNPYGDQWGNMHWGHARSRDLVQWEHLPVAVWPSKSKGEDHVFSGSTYLDDKGKPVIFYTSIGGRDPEQWIATPADHDLMTWSKPDVNPVLTEKAHGREKIDEWRDPFLFTEGGTTYMVVGGRQNGQGAVAAYRAENPELTRWQYLGILFRHPSSNLIECPNIVKLGDRWVFLASHDGRVDWFMGRLDLRSLKFDAERNGVLAEGSYASQLLTDRNGKCVHLAWVHTSDRKGWNGFMTLPSTLSLNAQGDVIRKPIAALSKLRDRKVEIGRTRIDGEVDLGDGIRGDLLEIQAEIDPGTASKIHLRLGAMTVTYDARERKLLTPGRAAATVTSSGNLKLQLFLDRSCLDVYADGGAITQAVAHAPMGVVGLRVGAEGGVAQVRKLTAYTLKPAKFDLSRFK